MTAMNEQYVCPFTDWEPRWYKAYYPRVRLEKTEDESESNIIYAFLLLFSSDDDCTFERRRNRRVAENRGLFFKIVRGALH